MVLSPTSVTLLVSQLYLFRATPFGFSQFWAPLLSNQHGTGAFCMVLLEGWTRTHCRTCLEGCLPCGEHKTHWVMFVQVLLPPPGGRLAELGMVAWDPAMLLGGRQYWLPLEQLWGLECRTGTRKGWGRSETGGSQSWGRTDFRPSGCNLVELINQKCGSLPLAILGRNAQQP